MNNNIDIDEYAKWVPLIGTQEMKDANLPAPFVEHVIRIKSIYDYWRQFPNKSNTDLVEHIIEMHHIKKTQAYFDIQVVKLLLGNIDTNTKDFWRWRINEIILKHMELARRKGDMRSLAQMEKNLVLNNKTDKEDPVELGFASIKPQEFFMSGNIDILIPGREKTSRERKNKIAKSYGIDLENIEDADYEEVKDKDNDAAE